MTQFYHDKMFSITLSCSAPNTYILSTQPDGLYSWLLENVGVENEDWKWWLTSSLRQSQLIVYLPDELIASQCKLRWSDS